MNVIVKIFFVAGLASLITFTFSTFNESKNAPAAGAGIDFKSLHRVTDQPHLMDSSTAELCRAPVGPPRNPHESIGDRVYCHIYVNELAKEVMMHGNGDYPVGSIIVKSKLATKNELPADLYTVMKKMPKGYHPEHGDWEYSVLDGESKQTLASGRIDSCIDCHQAFKDTDYVTRLYMKKVK